MSIKAVHELMRHRAVLAQMVDAVLAKVRRGLAALAAGTGGARIGTARGRQSLLIARRRVRQRRRRRGGRRRAEDQLVVKLPRESVLETEVGEEAVHAELHAQLGFHVALKWEKLSVQDRQRDCEDTVLI